jgi:hypothetical protein
LSAVVNRCRARPRAAERTQIGYYAIFNKKRPIGGGAVADDLTMIVDTGRHYTSQDAEIVHFALAPQEYMDSTASSVGDANDITSVVDAISTTRSASESSEIGGESILPEPRMVRAENIIVHRRPAARDLASIVDPIGNTAQIEHPETDNCGLGC